MMAGAPEIDRQAMVGFLRFGYVPAPLSIYRGIEKLAPGTILEIGPNEPPLIAPFWTLSETVGRARLNPFRGNDDEAEEALHELLGDAVRRRMVADVPLGAFLSGGIDSSTVAALMQEASDRPVALSPSASMKRAMTRRATLPLSPRISAPTTPNSMSRRTRHAMSSRACPKFTTSLSRIPRKSRLSWSPR